MVENCYNVQTKYWEITVGSERFFSIYVNNVVISGTTGAPVHKGAIDESNLLKEHKDEMRTHKDKEGKSLLSPHLRHCLRQS